MPGTDETDAPVASRIPTLLAGEQEWEDALERFVLLALRRDGHWSDWQSTDGIGTIRVHERSADHLRVCAHVWDIEGPMMVFWLDLDRRGAAPAWALHFDVSAKPERFRRNAVHLISSPDQVGWAVVVRSACPRDEGDVLRRLTHCVNERIFLGSAAHEEAPRHVGRRWFHRFRRPDAHRDDRHRG